MDKETNTEDLFPEVASYPKERPGRRARGSPFVRSSTIVRSQTFSPGARSQYVCRVSWNSFATSFPSSSSFFCFFLFLLFILKDLCSQQITPVSKQHAYVIGMKSMSVLPPLTGFLLDSNTFPHPRFQDYICTDSRARGRVIHFYISLRNNKSKSGMPRPSGVEVGTLGCRAVRSPKAQLCQRSPGRTAASDTQALRHMVLTPLHVHLLPTGDSRTCWVVLDSSCTLRSCWGVREMLVPGFPHPQGSSVVMVGPGHQSVGTVPEESNMLTGLRSLRV